MADFSALEKALADTGTFDNSASAPTGFDYSQQSFNPATIRKNPYFLDDLRRYYESKGITDRTDDELFDLLLDDDNVRMSNTFAPFAVARGSWADVANDSEEDQQRFARLKQVVDQQPFFFQEGGRGMSAIPSIIKGAATDPLNYLTGGASALIGATRAGRALAAGSTSGRALLSGTAAGARSGAAFEAGVGALSGGISSAGEQATRVELGMQDEVSSAMIFEEALLSGALSGTIGAFIGGIGGAVGASRATKTFDTLKTLGYTNDEILGMGLRQGEEVARNRIPPARAEGEEVIDEIEAGDPAAQVAEVQKRQRAEEQTRESLRLNSQLEAYRSYHTELTTELDEMIADGASERRIATVQQQIANVRRLREFHGRMANEREQIDDLLASNEPSKIAEGERRAAQYEQDLAQLKSMIERPVPEDMRRFIDERIAREDEAAKRAAEEAAQPTTTEAVTPSQSTEAPSQLESQSEATLPTGESPAPTAEVTPAANVPSAPDELADLIPDDAAPEAQARARTAIRDFAIEQGVDIEDVKASGANGVVTKTDIKTHLETAGPSRSFVDADALVAEGIDILQARFGNLPEVIDGFRANTKALANFIINEKAITDPKLQRAINDLLDFSARGDAIPDEAQPIKFSESDRKRIRRRVSEIKRNNPDTPNLIAQHMAEQEAMRFRSESGPQTRSAQPAIDRAASLPTAGRNNSGKIQSFLRPAATFKAGTEDEYSIAGRFTTYGGSRASKVGDIPTEAALSFEEAIVRASSQKAGHEFPVAFTADAPLRLADSKRPAQKGETVWADGRSGKAYRDWRNIYEKYYGYVPPETPSTIKNQMGASRRDAPAAKLASSGDLVAALGRGEIDAAEFSRRIAKLQSAGAPKPAAADLPPLQRDDGRVALFVKKSGGTTRQATPSDIAEGLTAQDIIGTRSSMDDWHVFYVPADTPNTQVGRAMAARQTRPSTPDPKIPARGALDYDQYQRITFHNSDLTPEDWRALEVAASLQKDPDTAIRYIGDIQSRDAGVTGQLVSRLINNIEGGQLRPFNKDSIHTSNWPSSDAGRRSMIRLLTQLYDLQTRMAPDGVALPAANREAAVADIGRIFSSFGPEQLALAREAINNLNSAARPAFLRGGDDVAASEAVSRTGDRLGSVSFGKGFKAKRELPQIATLYHELAHWSYMNVLTPAERLRFWDVMGKYYDEGGAFMPKEVARRSPLAKEAGKVYGPQNALNSPSEFFANQFSMRMMQRAQLPDPEGLWSRITRFVKAIFDRFFAKDSIDPDLEPFFARILPDEQRKAVEVQSFSETPPITDLADLIPDEVIPETPAIPQAKSAKSVREQSRAARAAPTDAPTRDGPAENYLSLSREELAERADPSRESFVNSLYTNEHLLNDLEDKWRAAHQLDDPAIAIEAAQETIRYLRGSAFTRDQARRFAQAAARATGTEMQEIRTKAIYGPYQRAGKLATNMRSKVYDLSAILRGKDVVGIEDALDDSVLDTRLSGVAEVAFGSDGFSVSGNAEEIGSRLLQLYRHGKKNPDGSYRRGSALSDVFNLAHKALNTSFERVAMRPKKGADNTRITAKGFTQVKIGKFEDVRIGNTYVRKSDAARAEVFTVTDFVERDDGFRVAQMRLPDGGYEELTPENAALFRNGGVKGANLIEVADKLAADIKTKIATRNQEATNLVDARKSEARGRTAPSALAAARPDQPSPRTLSEAALREVIVNEADNVASERAADELVSKERSRVFIPTKRKPKSVPDDLNELALTVDESFRFGDEDTDNWAAAFLDANGGKPVITFQDAVVLDAITREKDATRTAGRDVGVPGNTDSATREVLLGSSHRKRRHLHNARTVAYRILNLANREQLTRDEVAHWLAVDTPDWAGDDLFGITTDPLYKSFRETVRRIGSFLEDAGSAEGGTLDQAVDSLVTILRRMDDEGDAVLGVIPQVALAADSGKAADTWFAMAIRHRLLNTKGKPVTEPKVDPNAAPSDLAAVNDLISRTLDRMGYVTNGLIGSETVRDVLYRLTWFGDPFLEKTPASTRTPRAKPMSTTQARYLLDDLQNAPAGKLAALSRFVGSNFNVSKNVRFFRVDAATAEPRFNVETGNYGSAIYLDKSPSSGVDSATATNHIAAIKDPTARERANMAIAELRDIMAEVNPLASRGDADADARINRYIERENALLDILADEQVPGINRFVPVVVRAKNPLVVYATIDTEEKLALMRELFSRTSPQHEHTQAAIARGFDRAIYDLKTNGVGDIPMARVLSHLSDASDKAAVNKMIRDAGYDSIDTGGKLAVFSPENIRLATDPTFDMIEERAIGARISPAGAILNKLIDSDLKEIPVEKMPLILAPLSKAEPDRGVTNFLGNVMRGRKPTGEDVDAVIRFGDNNRATNALKVARGWLRSNSDSLRDLGMNWMADWFETTFQDTTQSMAKMLYGTRTKMGPMRALQSLPDSTGMVKNHLRRWFRRASADALGTRKWGADQPESHKKILRALRNKNPRQWTVLSTEERGVANVIRRQFRDTLEQLRASGVAVGDLGEDYFPQVWDAKSIRDNKEDFIGAMSAYLRAERRSLGRPVDEKEIANTASRMFISMSDSEFEGLFMDAMGHSRKSSAENLDYSRLLRLNEFEEGAQLKKFLEGDLEAILVKYYDAAARRLKQVEKFGNSNHGAYDYLRVVREGQQGIAYLLSHNRVERSQAASIGPDGLDEVTFADNVVMPFQGNEYKAHEAAGQIMEIHDQLGAVAAREYLMQLAPLDIRTQTPSTAYLRRVDAIIAALDDFEGVAQDITQDAYKFVENVLTVANRKTLATNKVALGASRAIRNFNSISLLGFTMLSSLGDAVLPLVRSGDMRTWLGAIRKMAGDPEYRRIINNVGASMESMLHDRMTHLWGSAESKFSNAFFSSVGLTPWTDSMRAMAASVGYETFAAMQQKAIKAYRPGAPVNEQPRQFKQAYRILKQYGLENYATNTAQSLADKSLLETDDLLRTAVIRFADDSVFAPNPNEIPIWAQTPLGAVVFQLKSFPLMMMRMSKEVLFNDLRLAIHDIRGTTPPPGLKGSGNLNRAKHLLMTAPLFGAGVLISKDIVQGRGEDENGRPTHSVRERLGSNFFGGEPWDNETVDAYAGWYLESMGMIGGFGLLVEMLHDALGQADNGAYGMVRTASTIFGPSVGVGTGAFNVGAGILDASKDALFDREAESNSKERLAVREVATRVPLLGGMRPFREGVVDAIAGEKEERGRRDTQRAAKAGKTPDLPDYSKLF